MHDQVIIMFNTVRYMVDEGIEKVPLKVWVLGVRLEGGEGRKGLNHSVKKTKIAGIFKSTAKRPKVLVTLNNSFSIFFLN